MAKKRITELTEATTVKSGHYIPVDHGTDGTQKMSMSTLIDNTLSTSGKAADAKATGDSITELDARMDTFTSLPSGSTSGDAELIDIRVGADGTTYQSAGSAVRGQISEIKQDLQEIIDGGGGSGMTEEFKHALHNILEQLVYISADGQTYLDALDNALWPPSNLTSISCVYTQSGTVYDTDSLDDLKSDLVVTAHFSDNTTQTVTTYTLSGTLAEGTSTVTVTYAGKTTTFTVTVTAILYPMVNASHTFTDGNVLSVSNGNHVTLQLNSNITSGTGTGINLYDVTENKDTVYDSANVGQQSQKFVIPSGASCVFKVRNLNTSLTFEGDVQFNLRNTNGVSIGSSSRINCGKVPTEQEYSATWTQSASVAIGLIFLFTNQITGAPGSLQFDVELYVNNARWI